MKAFWSASDLLVWAGLLLPSLLLGATLANVFPWTKAPKQMAAQFLSYLIWFLFLKLLFLLKYSQPFWRSLAWTLPRKGLWWCLVAGPVLAFGLNFLAIWMKAPPVKPPFEDLLFDRRWQFVYGVASVLLGPLSEELAFRGFLMPLVAKWLGAASGVVITGVLFALAHGFQNKWLWQYVMLLSVVGSAAGYVRWKYDSTMSSMVLHSSFNLTVFLGNVLK